MHRCLACLLATTALRCHARQWSSASTQHEPIHHTKPPEELVNLLLANNPAVIHRMREGPLASLPIGEDHKYQWLRSAESRMQLKDIKDTITEVLQERRGPFGFFQREVPDEFQPTAELDNIKNQLFGKWLDSDAVLLDKLKNLYIIIMLFLSLPAAYDTYYNLPNEFWNLFIAANMSTFPLMLFALVKPKIDWDFTLKRLMAADTYYEDKGGFEAPKDKQTILRDRLLAKAEAFPRVRRVNIGLGLLAAATAVSNLAGEGLVYAQGTENAVYTAKVITGDEAREFVNKLETDSDFANEQADRQRSRSDRPAYCDVMYASILVPNQNANRVC